MIATPRVRLTVDDVSETGEISACNFELSNASTTLVLSAAAVRSRPTRLQDIKPNTPEAENAASAEWEEDRLFSGLVAQDNDELGRAFDVHIDVQPGSGLLRIQTNRGLAPGVAESGRATLLMSRAEWVEILGNMLILYTRWKNGLDPHGLPISSSVATPAMAFATNAAPFATTSTFTVPIGPWR